MLQGIFQGVLGRSKASWQISSFCNMYVAAGFFGGFEDLAVEELSFSLLRGAWVFGAFGFTGFWGVWE